MTDFHTILLASDYDRTMTGFDGRVPQKNLDAVDELIARGGAFTICTGRSLPMFQEPLSHLRVNAPVILFNGAAVYDMRTQEATVLSPLPPDYLNDVRAISERYPHLRVELQGMRHHHCFGHDELRDAYLVRNGNAPRYVGWDEVDDTVLSFSFYAPFLSVGHSRTDEINQSEERDFLEIEQLIQAQFSDRYFAVRSMPRMIEMGPVQSGKGVAARWLANRLGRGTLVCAGDAPNDLSMLEEADMAFIPAGCDPAMEGRGFETAANCDEGLIASILARLQAL